MMEIIKENVIGLDNEWKSKENLIRFKTVTYLDKDTCFGQDNGKNHLTQIQENNKKNILTKARRNELGNNYDLNRDGRKDDRFTENIEVMKPKRRGIKGKIIIKYLLLS